MEAPIVIFVQAHGGGSDKLDGKFMTFNNYRKSTAADSAQRTTNPLFPVITRIVAPMRSALSDYESDRANVNFLYSIFTNPETRARVLKLPNTRHAHGAYSKEMEGARSQGELIKNISLFRSNDIVFNEMVEVELKKGEIHYKEGGDEDPGGFGIFIHSGEDWQYNPRLSRMLIDELTGDSIDISLLKITNKLVNILGTNNIVVVFPNCSPIGDASYTTATERSMWSRIRLNANRLKRQINPISQFQLAVEIVARVKNFFEGQERFQEFLSGEGFLSRGASKSDESKQGEGAAASANKKSSKSKKKKKTGMMTEDRIGILGNDDILLIIQLFFYFFKDYNDWIYLQNKIDIPEVRYILGQESVPANLNIGKFIMCFLLLTFKCHEKYGGILFDSREKGREYIWRKIIEQSRYGPKGRVTGYSGENLQQREGERQGKELQKAQVEQDELLEFVERASRDITRTDPRTPRHENHKILLQFAIDFATDINKKGGQKKTKKKKHYTKRPGKANRAAKIIQKNIRGRQSRKKTIDSFAENPFATGKELRRTSLITRDISRINNSESKLARDIRQANVNRVRREDEMVRNELLNTLPHFLEKDILRATDPRRLLRMNSREIPIEEQRARIAMRGRGKKKRKTRRKKGATRRNRVRHTTISPERRSNSVYPRAFDPRMRSDRETLWRRHHVRVRDLPTATIVPTSELPVAQEVVVGKVRETPKQHLISLAKKCKNKFDSACRTVKRMAKRELSGSGRRKRKTRRKRQNIKRKTRRKRQNKKRKTRRKR